MASQLKLKNFQGVTESKPSLEAPGVMIQCGFCHTKYSVPADTIAGLSSPKFHCFRCESVFEIDTNAAAQDFRPLFPSANIEVPAKSEPTFSVNKMTEGGLKVKSQSSPWKIEDKKIEQPVAPVRREFSFGNLNPAQHISKIDLSWGKKISSAVKQSVPQFEKKFEKKIESGSFIAEKKDASPAFQKYAILLLPAFLLLFVMIAMAVFSPKLADLGFDLSRLLPGNLYVPPATLAVENLKIEKASLTGGEQITLLNGDIVNHGAGAFGRVVLEGLVFDSLGRKIKNVQSVLGNDLADVKVDSLNKNMLAELTTAKRSIKKVSQDSEQKFSLAFTGDIPEGARFFTARVYSAQTL